MISGSSSQRTNCQDSFESQLERGLSCRLALVLVNGNLALVERLKAWIFQAQEAAWPVTWVKLEPGHNDPLRLLEHLRGALGLDEEPAGQEDGLNDLLNRLAEGDHPLLVVLEGYDTIQEPAAHALLARLVDYLPPNVHIYLLSQGEIPLPLARWLVRRQVVVVNEDR